MGYNWFAVNLLYYGLILNVGSFGLNIYLTQFIFGVVELPAQATSYPLMQRIGRRTGVVGFLLFGGASCLMVLAIPKDLPAVVTTIAVIGGFAASASFNVIYAYTTELYPTILRQNGFGVNSMFGRVAGILAPLVRLLDVYHHSIPMLIYGIVPITAAGLCLLLPETLNVELQDHTEPEKPSNGALENAEVIIQEEKL